MEVRATAKTLRIPPRKARLVSGPDPREGRRGSNCHLQVHTERCG